MILWFRHLPYQRMELSEWVPFIRNNWFRRHYMKFVYLVMLTIFLAPNWFGADLLGVSNFYSFTSLVIMILSTFIIHEALHILVIYTKGDISLTFQGIFFWLNTNEILSKKRFWIFMSLPLISLSVIPAVLSFYCSGNLRSLMLFISWVNLIISSSDIINSFIILIKPNKSVFCRGYYRVEKAAQN